MKKITLGACAWILVFLASPFVLRPVLADPASQIAAIAYPKDPAFLFDQIELELTIPSPEPAAGTLRFNSGKVQFHNGARPQKFFATTRPGQFLMVGLPVPGDENLVQQFAFIIQPEVDGELVSDHAKLEGVSGPRLSFNIHPFCLEETPLPNPPEELTNDGICTPRDRRTRQSDDVSDFAALAHVSLNRAEKDPTTGITFKIVKYRQRVLKGAEDLGSFARACLDVDGVNVCSCKVSNGARTNAAGCI